MSITSVVSRRCFIVRNGSCIKVISPERSKTLTLSANLINTSTEITDDQRGIIDRMVDGLVDGIEDKVDLTIEEMQELVKIKQASESYAATTKPASTLNPTGNGTTSHGIDATADTNKFILNGHKARESGHALNATERKVIGLKNVVDIYKEDFYQVEYDIKTTLSKLGKKRGGVDNPSDWFWYHAMRLTKSCWVFPESHLRHQEVVEWMDDARAKGCKIRVIKYAKDQIELLRRDAIEELREAVVELHTGLIDNIARADMDLETARKTIEEQLSRQETDQLAASQTERERIEYRNNRVRSYLRNSIEYLRRSIASAELFDMTENVQDLIDAYRATIRSRSLTFNVMARERGVTLAPIVNI